MASSVPDFGQFVEYVTDGPTFHLVDPAQHSIDAQATLEAVAADYEKVAQLGRGAALTEGDLASLRADAAEFYPQEVIDSEIVSDPAVTFDRLAWVRSRPDWRPGIYVENGTVLWHAARLWECTLAHPTAVEWPPGVAVALFRPYYVPDEVTVWRQPVSSYDAYPLDHRVTHAGKTWRSLIAANVWEPGSVGSDALWFDETPAPATPVWTVGNVYHLNDVVSHNGVLYKCMQPTLTAFAHQQPGAPGMTALWQTV